MKPVKFWTNEVKLLSALERVYLADAFRSLLSWDVLKKEHRELDLIRRILESEIRHTEINRSEIRADKKTRWYLKDLNVK